MQDTGHYNSYTKEDMLADILDLLDCNGLDIVTEPTMEEWKNLTKQSVKVKLSGFGKYWNWAAFCLCMDVYIDV